MHYEEKTVIALCVIILIVAGYVCFTQFCKVICPNITETINKAVLVSSEISHIIDEDGNYSEELA